jgi:Trk K+ transport system NAD-binding subunit
MSNFLVIGLNAMGRTLARELARRGGSVTVADASESRVSRIKNEVKAALVIDTTDKAALADLHAERFDHAVVCMGHQFESSELTTLALRDVGARSVTAVATTKQRRDILRALGATTVVTPGLDTARNLAVELAEESFESFQYADARKGFGTVVLARRQKIDAELVEGMRALGVNLVAVKQRASVAGSDEEPTFAMPAPQGTALAQGDRVLLFGAPDDIVRAVKKKLA